MVMWPDELVPGHLILEHVLFRRNATGGINLFSTNYNGPPRAISMQGVEFQDNGGLSMRWYPDGAADIAADTVADEPVHLALKRLHDTRPWVVAAPFVLEEGLYLADGGELHLADNELRFERGTGIDHLDAGLFLDGVLLTSAAATPTPGDWDGIVTRHPGGPIVLDGCVIEHADAGKYGVVHYMSGGKPEQTTIEGTTFRSNVGLANVYNAEGHCARLLSAGNTFDLEPCVD